MGWIEFALAMGLFLVSHRIPAALGLKEHLIRRLGARGYLFLFSLGSVLLLWWVIVAAGRAPSVALWDQTPAARLAVNLAMPVVVLLTVFGVAAPNPFAFEGRPDGFDPQAPGIAGLTRQPLLWALLLWSSAHLWVNGDLAHVFLFGSFAVFSLLGMKIVERRRARQAGPAEWARLSAHTGLLPGAALLSGRWRPGLAKGGIVRFTFALAAYAALYHSHEIVIGASPAP